MVLIKLNLELKSIVVLKYLVETEFIAADSLVISFTYETVIVRERLWNAMDNMPFDWFYFVLS